MFVRIKETISTWLLARFLTKSWPLIVQMQNQWVLDTIWTLKLHTNAIQHRKEFKPQIMTSLHLTVIMISWNAVSKTLWSVVCIRNRHRCCQNFGLMIYWKIQWLVYLWVLCRKNTYMRLRLVKNGHSRSCKAYKLTKERILGLMHLL